MNDNASRPRLRRSIAVEVCEPRHMLSAAAVAADPVAVVGQALESQLSSQAISFGKYQWVFYQSSSAGSGAVQLTSEYIWLRSDTIPASEAFNNAYGASPDVQLSIDGDVRNKPTVHDLGHTEGMPLRTAPVTGLDPFSPPASNTPPPDTQAPMGVSRATTIALSAGTDAAATQLASTAWSGATDGAQPTARLSGDPSAQRWLSASFTPAEQQRLDAPQGAKVVETQIKARDARGPSALEPTRLIAQTFCLVPRAATADTADQLDRSNSWRSAPAARKESPAMPRSTTAPSAAMQSAALQAAARDAAILALVPAASAPPINSAVSLASGHAAVLSPELLVESDPESAETDAPTGDMAVPFFEDWRNVGGALLAGTALQLLWARGECLDTQTASAPTLTLPRRRSGSP